MSDGKIIIETLLDNTGISKGISKINSLAKSGLKTTIGIISGVTASMGAIGTFAIKAGSEFEAGMSKVQAIAGASGDELISLTEKAKEMGIKTKYSATEAAEAMQYMAMAGWDTEDMLNGVEGVMDLAAASGEDLAATSDIVTDALTAFGLSAKDSSHFADILAKASSRSNTNVGMMGETFKYVAPLAGSLGFSAEDTAVAIGLMANSGIKAGQAGTALRSVLTRLSKPTKDVQSAMDELGVSLTDSDGNMKSLDEIMGGLRESFKGLSKAEKIQYAATIAGQEGMSGLLAIVNAADGDFENLKNEIYNCNGAADEMAATMQDNLKGKIDNLKSSAEGFGIEIYESMSEPLKNLAQVGIDSINTLTESFSSGGLTGLTQSFGGVLSNLTTGLTSGLPQIMDIAVQVTDAFVTGISQSIPALAESVVQLGVSFFNGIVTIFPNVMQAGYDMARNLMDGVAAQAPQLIQKGAQCIREFLQGLVANAPSLLQSGVNLLQQLGTGIAQALPSLIPVAVQTLVSLASSLVSNIGSIIDVGIQILTALAEGIVNSLPILIEQVPKIINDFWAAFDQNLFKLISAGVKIIIQLGKGIVQSIPLIIKNAGEIVKAVFNTIMHINLLKAGKTLIKNLGSGIKSMAGSIKNSAKDIATKLWNTIKNTNWLELGRKVIIFIRNGITNMTTAAVKAGGNVAKGIWNTIKSVNWLDLGGKVIKFVGNGIKSAVKFVAEAGLKAAKAGMTAIKNCDWLDIGKNIIKGVVSGITGMASSLATAALDAAKGAISKVKGWLGIHSPSRRFRDEVGKNIIKGIVVGLRSEQKNLNNSMQASCRSLESTAKRWNSHYEDIGSRYSESIAKGIDKKAGDSAKAIKNIVEKNIKALGEKNKKAKSEYTKAGRAVINAYNTAVKTESKKLKESVTKSLEDVSVAAQAQYDKLIDQKSAMRDKIAGFGNMLEDGKELLIVGNLENDVNTIKQYQKNLENLKGRIPESLMQEILGMDIDEANKYVAALDNLTDDAFEKYIKLWNEKQSLSKNISDDYYKDDLAQVKANFEKQVAEITKKAKTSSRNLAKTMSRTFADELKKESKGLSKTAKAVADDIAKSFSGKKKKSSKKMSKKQKNKANNKRTMPAGVVSRMKSTVENEKSRTTKAMSGKGGSPKDRKHNPDNNPVKVEAVIHTHVDLDGREVGEAVTPFVSKNMAKKKGRTR